ncbi:MAG: hypothetical protein JXA44_10810 [Methanospirillaceae archaeon]|nr:hypothetical protein [Methanospirillaceae archaeon]
MYGRIHDTTGITSTYDRERILVFVYDRERKVNVIDGKMVQNQNEIKTIIYRGSMNYNR